MALKHGFDYIVLRGLGSLARPMPLRVVNNEDVTMRLSNIKSLLALAGAGFLSLMTALPAAANQFPKPKPGVVPVDGISVDKRTYNELAGDWWNWATIDDLEGEGEVDCGRGQRGRVWFLAGQRGSGELPPITRSCVIPEGKQLFFPILNTLWWTPEDGATVPEVRAPANANINLVDSLTVEVDGVDVKDIFAYRAQSPAGGFVWNNDDYQQFFGLEPFDRDSVTDGFWILLKPLSKGEHTIRFAGSKPPFALDVTYYITVIGRRHGPWRYGYAD